MRGGALYVNPKKCWYAPSNIDRDVTNTRVLLILFNSLNVTNPNTIETIVKPNGLKAMIVAPSRDAAVTYKTILDQMKAPESKIVMS